MPIYVFVPLFVIVVLGLAWLIGVGDEKDRTQRDYQHQREMIFDHYKHLRSMYHNDWTGFARNLYGHDTPEAALYHWAAVQGYARFLVDEELARWPQPDAGPGPIIDTTARTRTRYPLPTTTRHHA